MTYYGSDNQGALSEAMQDLTATKVQEYPTVYLEPESGDVDGTNYL